MRHLTVLQANDDAVERAGLALRIAVCRNCPGRPRGSRATNANSPLACEDQCGLFHHLPRIMRYAKQIDPMVGSFNRIVRGYLWQVSQRRVMANAKTTERAGDARPGQSPWWLHADRITSILRNLVGQ